MKITTLVLFVFITTFSFSQNTFKFENVSLEILDVDYLKISKEQSTTTRTNIELWELSEYNKNLSGDLKAKPNYKETGFCSKKRKSETLTTVVPGQYVLIVEFNDGGEVRKFKQSFTTLL
jgi:hypothetical protein